MTSRPPRPLWNENAPPAPAFAQGASRPARPVAFAVRGRQFLYEPHDMRLHESSDPGRDLLAALADPPVQSPVFPPASPSAPSARPAMVVCVLTRQCNLRCHYCFVPRHAPEPDPASAPADTVLARRHARDAIARIDPRRDLAVGFFGGEPLLARQRLREIVDDTVRLARERRVDTRFSLTTNAVLLDDDTLDFLEHHRFGLVASLDGPAPLHNAHRPDAQGHGSYDAVLAALQRLARRPALARRLTLRGTFAGDEDGQGVRLVERVAHLNDLARNFGFGNVSVEPADLAEGCAASGRVRPVQAADALADEYYDLAAWYVRERRAGRHPLFHHFAVRLDRLRRRAPAPAECGAGVGYLSVDPEGRLHACHRLGPSRLGDRPGQLDPRRQTPWRDNRYTARLGCPDCWLRNVCGGGCRLNSLARSGDIRQPDALGCWLTAVCFRAAAWILAEEKEDENGERPVPSNESFVAATAPLPVS